MGDFPKIKTAIPRRRYQVGEYGVSVLGEIESNDPVSYVYIMAFVPEGENQPVLYLCSEKTPPKERHEGGFRLRLINSAMSEVMDVSEQWRDLDAFCETALTLGMQSLGLTQESIARLM